MTRIIFSYLFIIMVAVLIGVMPSLASSAKAAAGFVAASFT